MAFDFSNTIFFSAYKTCDYTKYFASSFPVLYEVKLSVKTRISERMSSEELAIYFANLAYTAHIRQNRSTLSKYTLQKKQ